MADIPGLQLISACDATACMDHWDLFNGFVEQQAESILGTSKEAYQLRLASEELFSNIIRHANRNETGSSCTHLWVRALRSNEPHPCLVIELEDNGPHFDPLFEQRREIKIDQTIEQRPIGGLGLFLVQNSVDHVEYSWIDGHNRYRLFVNLPAS